MGSRKTCLGQLCSFLAFSSVLVFYSPINIFKSHCEGLGIGDRKRELREEGQGSRLEAKI